MSEDKKVSETIYSKPIVFALVATLLILIGTLATTFGPMALDSMHPKLENLRPFSPLELAGRDIYQREGCINCHTQTVRPLKAEVMRYGEYSKAGEFAYDRPSLWGSKRTGPDLARVGLRLPKAVHYKHFEDPKSTVPASIMPVYGWMKEDALDVAEIKSHMDALSLPYTEEDLKELDGKNDLDALVAYMLSLGHAIKKAPKAGKEAAELSRGEVLYSELCAGCHGDKREGGYGPALVELGYSEGDLKELILKGTGEGMPGFEGSIESEDLKDLVTFLLGGGAEAATPSAGAGLYNDNCAGCHDATGTGGYGPSLIDNTWLGKEVAMEDAGIKEIIIKGTEGGMPPWAGTLSDSDIDEIIKHIRVLGGGAEESTPPAGAGLYSENCAGCHDASGTGGYGPSLVDNKWLDKEGPIEDAGIKEIILKGTEGGMPPWAGTLSDSDIDSIIEHIRALAK